MERRKEKLQKSKILAEEVGHFLVQKLKILISARARAKMS